MGMYDGDGSSTAMVAEALGLPVVLVVDAKAGMESVAATALGFREYAATIDRDVDVAGVVAQRCHGGRHAEGVRDALPRRDGLPGAGSRRAPPSKSPTATSGWRWGASRRSTGEALAEAADSIDVEALLRHVAREPPKPPADDDNSDSAASRTDGSSPSRPTTPSVSLTLRPSNGSASAPRW